MGVLELGVMAGAAWSAMAGMAIALGVVAARGDHRCAEALARHLASQDPGLLRKRRFARTGSERPLPLRIAR
jgi:hypothetical protein